MKNNFTELAITFKYEKTEKNYSALFNAIRKPLLKYINGIVKDSAVANDIFQDVALKVFQKIDKYNENFSFSTWVYTISKNECFIHLKKLKARPKVSLSHQTETGIDITDNNDVTVVGNVNHESSFIEIDAEIEPDSIDFKFDETMDLIDSLDEKYKVFLIEKYVNNLKEKEIAAKYGVSKSTVKNRLFHGRKKIQKQYANNHITV